MRHRMRDIPVHANPAGETATPRTKATLEDHSERKKTQKATSIAVLTLSQIRKRASIVGLVFDALLALIVFAVTVLTIYPMFSGDFNQNWGAMESAFLSDAVFVVNNYPHLGWYPYWYGGLSFYLSCLPSLPYLVAGLHFLRAWTIGHAYRVITGVAYAATPASLYGLTKLVSKSRVAALIAGLAYSLVPTFLLGLVPSHMEILAIYGEAPHVFTLPFVLLATAQLLRCMRRPSTLGYLTTAILVAVVALTNLIALLAFALFALLALATEIVYGKAGQAMQVFVLSALLSYGLVAFQYDLQFIQSLAAFDVPGVPGGSLVGLLSSPWLPAYFIISMMIPGLLLALHSSLGKAERSNAGFLALIWIAVFGTIVIGKQLFDMSLAPQPFSYTPELDLGVAFLVGLLAAGVVEKAVTLRRESSQSFKHIIRIGMTLFILAVLIFSSTTSLLTLSSQVTTPATSITDAPEYNIAQWLSAHMTDERVYATGTPAYWLNAFSNVQQMGGDSERGAVNRWWAPVENEIDTGLDPRLSVMWSEAWNVKYIVVTFPNATTTYYDYAYPEKFNDNLPLRYYYQGFGIYEVPLPQPALVQAVSAQAARSLHPISSVSDANALSNYIHIVDTSVPGTRVSYTRPNPDELSIHVSNASSDTAILVKMTYDQGWEAQLEDGSPISLSQIGPDFIVAYPQKSGEYRLDLHFNTSTSQFLGWFTTVTTLLLVVLSRPIRSVYRRRKRRAQFPRLNHKP